MEPNKLVGEEGRRGEVRKLYTYCCGWERSVRVTRRAGQGARSAFGDQGEVRRERKGRVGLFFYKMLKEVGKIMLIKELVKEL